MPLDDLAIDVDYVRRRIVYFLKNEFEKAGFEKAVIGLSGGLDSSTAFLLTVEALGGSNVIGISLPYKTTSNESIEDAKELAQTAGACWEIIDITPQIDAYFQRFPTDNIVQKGNKMARERMSILYDRAYVHGALVVGTGNKTEWLLGYTTRWGDSACDLAPLLDLYKTQVRQLAKAIGVPEKIIEKVPTAELWPGQTDEGELGFTYTEADQVLFYFVERGFTRKQLIAKGFSEELVDRIVERMKRMAYKRALPPYPRIY
ncbi:NAD+ synthase [bacterium]|nr:NAD+ synthase [bacterium]